MGYLSQRKKNQREESFLKISAIVLTFLSVSVFFPIFPESLQNGLFHIYLANIVVLLLAVCFSRYGYAVFFALILIVNYFHVSAYANVFVNSKLASEHSLKISYIPEKPFDIEASEGMLLKRRRVQITKGVEVPVITIDKAGHIFNILRVDFSSIKKSDQKEKAIKQLSSFISSQDDPVIVFGDFGEPVWSNTMRKFLSDTNLQVKNRVLLTQKGNRFDVFSAPSFYVLAFPNVGINRLEADFANGENYPLVNVELGFF